MRRSIRCGVIGAALAAAVVGLGPVALAATSTSTDLVQVRSVNALTPTSPVIGYFDTGSGAGSPPTVTLNNAAVKASTPVALGGDTPRCVAVVLDTSNAAETSSALVSTKAALKSWITGRTGAAQTDEEFSIYAANDIGVEVQSCTADTGKLTSAIDQVAPPTTDKGREKTALWSAVRQAAAGLSENGTLEPDLVIMSAQHDNASGDQKNAAIGEIASANAAVFGLAYTGSGYSGDELKSLSATYGGQFLGSGQGAQMGTLVSQVESTVDHGQFQVTVRLDDQGQRRRRSGAHLPRHHLQRRLHRRHLDHRLRRTSARQPTTPRKLGVSRCCRAASGCWLSILLVLVAVSMMAYGIFLLVTRDNNLNTVLQPYSEGYGPQDEADDPDEGSYAKTAIIQRAVEVTEQFAESQGYLARAEGLLERANLPLRAGEALFFYAAIVVIATILGFAVVGFIVGLVIGAFAAMVPLAIVSYLAGRRRKKFLSLLPDTLQLLSGTLRAGYSLMQGVEAISQEVVEPDGPGAAAGGHRVPAGSAARRVARGRGRAHGQPRLLVDGHGHPHPARGRRQPVRAPAHRGRHHDPA